MNVYEKLLFIQKKLNAPKSKYNKFGGYNYRSCEDILEGCKPLLDEVKATLFLSDDIVQIAERIYVKSTATLIDVESNEKISNTSFAREPLAVKGMSDSQITGAASTYARKYALNGLFCIDDTVDEDTSETTDEEKTKLEDQKKAAESEAKSRQMAQALAVKQEEKQAQMTDEQKNQQMVNNADKRLLVTSDNVMSAEQYDFLMSEINRTGQMQRVLDYLKISNPDDIKKITSQKCVAILVGLVKKPNAGVNNG